MTPLGITVYSKSRYRADDSTLPVGGVVIEEFADGDGELHVRTVTVYRGRVEYHVLAVADIEPGASGGLIRRDVLKQLVLHLSRDEVAHKDPFKHTTAKRAIEHVMADAGDDLVRGRGR